MRTVLAHSFGQVLELNLVGDLDLERPVAFVVSLTVASGSSSAAAGLTYTHVNAQARIIALGPVACNPEAASDAVAAGLT